jgi:CRISPR-associated protein Csa1
MVYFLNDIEQKYLLMHLRPMIRSNPVPEELRGWNWHTPPLKPYYDVRLPMYLICSKYCDTMRDVYLVVVEKVRGEETFSIQLGRAVHNAVSTAINRAKTLDFTSKPEQHENESIMEAVNLVWEYTMAECRANFLKARAVQNFASQEDIILTSIPFLVEHRMDGSLLGCSGIIAVDCYDYLRNIVFDIKVGNKIDELNARLYTTGYALVVESLYEIPVDVGCTVYISFKRGLSVVRDLHYIDANLRSYWVEERDKKAEMVYNETDPGKPDYCNPNCLYRGYCL